jgi:hypothetical protein
LQKGSKKNLNRSNKVYGVITLAPEKCFTIVEKKFFRYSAVRCATRIKNNECTAGQGSRLFLCCFVKFEAAFRRRGTQIPQIFSSLRAPPRNPLERWVFLCVLCVFSFAFFAWNLFCFTQRTQRLFAEVAEMLRVRYC